MQFNERSLGHRSGTSSRPRPFRGLLGLVLAMVLSVAACSSSSSPSASRPSQTAAPRVTPAHDKVVLMPDGRALAPSDTSTTADSRRGAIAAMVAAANRLVGLPYRYGGGHRPYLGTGHQPDGKLDTGYDGS